MNKKKLSNVFGYLSLWCSACDMPHPETYMAIKIKDRKFYFLTKNDYEAVIDFLYCVNVDYDILDYKNFFEKKYHVRVTHYDDCHKIIIRDFYYDDFTTMKRCTEYMSKYSDCICEVIND